MIKKTLVSLLILSVNLGLICSQDKNGKFPLEDKITLGLNKYVEGNDLAGIITVVAKGDRILSLNCIGCQNTETQRKMNPNTLFWIASQTKTVTGTAIMMLVEKGLLDLDVPVTTYLPELKNLYVIELPETDRKIEKKATKPLTLRHLLSHTSGMKWVSGIQQKMGHIDVLPFSISLYSSLMTPLQSEPGDEYLYSNQGINIAATVLERVTGIPFETFLQENIFGPLEMSNTTFWPTEKQLKNFAPPHKRSETGKLVPSPIVQLQYPLSDKLKRFPEAAGGIFSTPLDLLKFYQMIVNKGEYKGKRILSEASIMEMWKRQTPEKKGMDSYGLGWRVTPEYMGHSGACGSESRAYMETGYILMYIAQENGLEKNKSAQSDFWRIANELYNYRIR